MSRARILAIVSITYVLLAPSVLAEAPKNVILLIGDGMGFEQVKAGSIYATGTENGLVLQTLPYQAQVTTYSADSSVTDSAAAATAMATGHKVYNGVISLALPGDSSELETALEYHKARGLSVGLVTSTTMTHATPAGFGAHNISRNNTSDIGSDYLNQTRPNVLLGGGANGLTPTAATNAGFDVVTTRTALLGLNTEDPLLTLLSGQFGTSHLPYEYDGTWGDLPHLHDIAATALAILDNNPNGFFLMIEGGRIDHACHDNNLQRAIYETIEFDDTVQLVLDWAAGRTDTLIIVTADHETGGLLVTQNNGQGVWPTVTWSTGGHTGANTPVFADGPNAHYVTGVLDNTQIFSICTDPSPQIVRNPETIDRSVMPHCDLPSYVDSFVVSKTSFDPVALDYTITTDVDWLDVDPASGTTSGENDTIWLVYNDIASLAAGSHVGTVTITSATASNSPQTVTVTVTVEPGPELVRSPATIDRSVMVTGSLPSYVDSFTVSRNGCDLVDYTITTDVPWLGVDTASGTVDGETDTIWLIYNNVADLAVGTHVGTIEIASTTASNSPQTVTVTVEIEPGPGDYDGDRDVDQDDFGHLQMCLGILDVQNAQPGCVDADLNSDNNVDQADRTLFMGCISGPGIQADVNCVP